MDIKLMKLLPKVIVQTTKYALLEIQILLTKDNKTKWCQLLPFTG